MMQRVIGLSDGVWAVVLERELALSQVWGAVDSNHKSSAPSDLSVYLRVAQLLGGSITLPPYYQAEEEFETRDSFLALSNIFSSRWAGLWEPLAKKLPNLTKAKLPQLLENINNINLYKLVYKLETVGGKTCMVRSAHRHHSLVFFCARQILSRALTKVLCCCSMMRRWWSSPMYILRGISKLSTGRTTSRPNSM